jgi:predicted metal-binding membrane protein
MIVAMMVPAALPNLRAAANRSLWSRRDRTVGMVLVGYIVIWLLFGLLLESVLALARHPLGVTWSVLTLLVAACWQITSCKRDSLRSCHRDPLFPPTGWRSDLACLKYGSTVAVRCCFSCWAMMVACAVSEHLFGITLLVAVVLWAERYIRIQPLYSFSAVLAATALIAVPAGVLPSLVLPSWIHFFGIYLGR